MPPVDTAINYTGLCTITAVAVASLPPASDCQGHRRLASDLADSLVTGMGKVAAGSGTTRGFVRSDGTSWRIAGV